MVNNCKINAKIRLQIYSVVSSASHCRVLSESFEKLALDSKMWLKSAIASRFFMLNNTIRFKSRLSNQFWLILEVSYRKLLLGAGRFLGLISAYSATAIILVASLAYASKHLSSTTLSTFLSLVFLTSLTSGLEIGTAKHVLHSDHNLLFARSPNLSFIAEAAKIGVITSVPIAIILHLQGNIPAKPATLLLVAVLVAVPGYLSTELKVFLDARGFHLRGILIKQAGLCLAYISYIICFAFADRIEYASLVACVLRMLLILAVLSTAIDGLSIRCLADSQSFFSSSSSLSIMKFMLASIFTCLSGSVDRIIALNVLSPLSASSYFAVFEVLSKFWLLPYIISPIVYSKIATKKAISGYLRDASFLIAIAGLLYILSSVVASAALRHMIPLPRIQTLSIFLMTTAIVISSFTQVFLSYVQALGRHQIVLSTISISMLSSCILFPLCYYLFGLSGFYSAWLVKSTAEILFLFFCLTLPFNFAKQ